MLTVLLFRPVNGAMSGAVLRAHVQRNLERAALGEPCDTSDMCFDFVGNLVRGCASSCDQHVKFMLRVGQFSSALVHNTCEFCPIALALSWAKYFVPYNEIIEHSALSFAASHTSPLTALLLQDVFCPATSYL